MIDDLERRVGTADVEKYPDEQKSKYYDYHKRLNKCVLEYVSQLHDIWHTIMSSEMGLHDQIVVSLSTVAHTAIAIALIPS